MPTTDKFDSFEEGLLLKAKKRFVESHKIYGKTLPKIIKEGDVVMFVGQGKPALPWQEYKVYHLLHETGIVKVLPPELRYWFDLAENKG